MTTAFNQAEFDQAYPDGVEHNYWSIARNRILHATIARSGLANCKWIEVGCGRGQVVKYLRSHNIETRGVELADVRPLPGVEEYVHPNTDATTLPGREQYAGMMLLDVIEHIEDPVAFVASLIRSYPNVRHLLVTVPARQEIWSNYDTFYGHFRRYDVQSLRREIVSLGFEPLKLHYFFHALYPAGLLALKLAGAREIRISAPTGWHRALHRVLGFGFALENALVPGGVPGTSLLCLSQLPDKRPIS